VCVTSSEVVVMSATSSARDVQRRQTPVLVRIRYV
jgi:hypothetical protein